MKQRSVVFLVVLLLSLNSVSAQKYFFKPAGNSSIGFKNIILKQPLQDLISFENKNEYEKINLFPIHNFYISSLGYFCKKELQLDKISIVPVRFRLGSHDYVNYLEQKPNAHRY